MVDPKILCTKHLLGEHVEHHMFVGTINKGNSIEGYIHNNLLEPLSIKKRHEELVNEMHRRKMNHASFLPRVNIEKLNRLILNHTIDRTASLNELIKRCPKCRKNYEEKSSKY